MPSTFFCRKIGAGELSALAKTRAELWLAAQNLPQSTDLSAAVRASRAYFARDLASDSCTTYFAYDGVNFVGCGSVDFSDTTPQTACISNVFTLPAYRRHGAAAQLLGLLLAEARTRGAAEITLETTAAGRPLYEKFGFVGTGRTMRLLLTQP